MSERDLRIGVDVGGTNTDAVVLDATDRVIARAKCPTSADVTGGVHDSLAAVLARLGEDDRDGRRVGRVMLGTTHATNAILQRRGLGRVAVMRLGSPATTAVPPLESWPADLRKTVAVDAAVLPGGHYIDGRTIAPLDADAVRRFLHGVAGRVDAVAVAGVFSPAFTEHELTVAELVRHELGDGVAVSMSHEIGALGLLERENATVLNAALYEVAAQVRHALGEALREHGLDAASYFAQNDGTLMAVDYAVRYPVLTIGSGPANSIRGAAFLSGLPDAIVADVGGTSTDLGVLVKGFPRQSAAGVEIGGVRTNFPMPDILAIALGGGTVVGADGALGPRSVGYRITEEAYVFGGGTPTMTDAAVAAGRAGIGWQQPPAHLGDLFSAALEASDALVADAVDRMALGRGDRPLVVVGGGAFLVPDDLPGVSKVIRPDDGDVANAVGAAIAQVSGSWDTIVPVGDGRRAALDEACEVAVRRAVQAGADPAGVEVVDMVEIPLSYLPEPASRVHVKAAGPLGNL